MARLMITRTVTACLGRARGSYLEVVKGSAPSILLEKTQDRVRLEDNVQLFYVHIRFVVHQELQILHVPRKEGGRHQSLYGHGASCGHAAGSTQYGGSATVGVSSTILTCTVSKCARSRSMSSALTLTLDGVSSTKCRI